MKMYDDDEIHPFNGHRGTPQDRLAVGCFWIIGAVPAIVIFMFVGQAIEHWWKGY